MPVINVASSAAKRHFETPLICKAIVKRTRQIVHAHQRSCGVIGLGTIGLQLASSLREMGCKVVGYDRNQQRVEMLNVQEQCESAADVLKRAKVIFGCTGDDCLRVDDLLGIHDETRIFASCSSSDVEFRSILLSDLNWDLMGRNGTPCPTLRSYYAPCKLKIKVLRSAYPINFDNSAESVPSRDIQLTRGLLFVAALQACKMIEGDVSESVDSVMLDPTLQRAVVWAWSQHTGGRLDRIPNVEWFAKESVPFRKTRLSAGGWMDV